MSTLYVLHNSNRIHNTTFRVVKLQTKRDSIAIRPSKEDRVELYDTIGKTISQMQSKRDRDRALRKKL
jgi:hypothetical protein